MKISALNQSLLTCRNAVSNSIACALDRDCALRCAHARMGVANLHTYLTTKTTAEAEAKKLKRAADKRVGEAVCGGKRDL